jgi:hypothetical protein
VSVTLCVAPPSQRQITFARRWILRLEGWNARSSPTRTFLVAGAVVAAPDAGTISAAINAET